MSETASSCYNKRLTMSVMRIFNEIKRSFHTDVKGKRKRHRFQTGYGEIQWSFPRMDQKFSDFSEFRECDKSMKHKLGLTLA